MFCNLRQVGSAASSPKMNCQYTPSRPYHCCCSHIWVYRLALACWFYAQRSRSLLTSVFVKYPTRTPRATMRGGCVGRMQGSRVRMRVSLQHRGATDITCHVDERWRLRSLVIRLCSHCLHRPVSLGHRDVRAALVEVKRSRVRLT